MISRLFVKDCLSFSKIDLTLNPGLIVFTGSSGVGKSVLMNSLLSLLGRVESESKQSELMLKLPFELDNYDNEEEYSVIQQQKKEKNRYFLNDLTISKKKLNTLTTTYIDSMNVRDFSIFENQNLINIIDNIVKAIEKNYEGTLEKFRGKYKSLNELKKELEEINENEKNVEELKSFLEFEITKIKEISPTNDEEIEELKGIQKQLNKKDKVYELIESTESFFESQYKVSKLLEFMEVDSEEFELAMNNVSEMIMDSKSNFENLEFVDIEETLTRIDQLNYLVKKYGSIEEAIKQLEIKESEYSKYSNIEFEKNKIEKDIAKLTEEVSIIDDKIYSLRKKYLKSFNERFNHYTELLFLKGVEIEVVKTEELTKNGSSEIQITLNGTQLNKVSSGELNRLKLALLVVKTEYSKENEGGILILDEIDANLSGKESESIGKLLFILSKTYQILSISHQPQLTSFANQHFLVEKENNVSTIRELINDTSRENEIARMISGSNITDPAKQFAREMIEESKKYMEQAE